LRSGGFPLSKSSSGLTWLVIIGVLVFGAALTALWPTISDQLNIGGSSAPRVPAEPENIVIDVAQFPAGDALIQVPFIRDNIDGLKFTPIVAAGLLVAMAVGGTLALGLPLAFIYTLLSKQTAAVTESESFKTARANLENRQNERIKAWQAAQPQTPMPAAEPRARWMLLSMTPLILLFVWFSGLALGHSLYGDTMWEINGRLVSPIQVLNLLLVVVTVIVLIVVARRIQPEAVVSGATDYQPVNWGMLWVLISGLLIVGVGTGLAFALRAGG
jgi:hypothetical protein